MSTIPSEFYFIIAIFLLINLLVGLIRAAQGPTRADRLLAAQLFGATTAAILALLAAALGLAALYDVALIFVLLAAMASMAFVRLQPPSQKFEP